MRKHPSLLASSAFVLSFVLAGCGSTQKIERNRVDPVKTAAIIGFGLQQMRPSDGTDVVNALVGNDEESVTAAPIAKSSPLADRMYEDLTRQLGARTAWKVLSEEQVRSNPAYQAFLKRHTKEPQLRPLVQRHVDAYVPEGIVEGFLLTNLEDGERSDLMHSLGIDAAVIVTVDSNLVNDANVFQKLTAHGKFKRAVGIRFAVYDRHGPDPIWFDGKSRDESTEGAEHGLGFASAERLDELAFSTARNVFSKVTDSYKTL